VIRVAVKALGDCTRRIQSIQPGAAARVLGAYGNFLAGPPSAAQLWVAGGIGITPFLALLRSGPVAVRTTLFYFHRPDADAPFLRELTDLARADPRISLHAMAAGNEAPNFNTLLAEAERLADGECYLCGPPGMIAGLRRALRRRGIAPRRIHFESFQLL
jgi:predicted ferric reductase